MKKSNPLQKIARTFHGAVALTLKQRVIIPL